MAEKITIFVCVVLLLILAIQLFRMSTVNHRLRKANKAFEEKEELAALMEEFGGSSPSYLDPKKNSIILQRMKENMPAMISERKQAEADAKAAAQRAAASLSRVKLADESLPKMEQVFINTMETVDDVKPLGKAKREQPASA